MNLVIVSRAIYPLHGYGGLERHCHDWIITMAELGCTVNVITMPPNHEYSEFPNSVRFHFIPGKPARKIFERVTSYPKWVDDVRSFLSQLIKKESIDAIYANGLAIAGCTGFSVPAFYNPHGMEEFKTSGAKFVAYSSFRSMSRNAAQQATKVIATDKSLVSEIEKFLNVPQEKIVIIPNSVRILELSLTAARKDSSDPLFISVGRLERNKGFHVLLEALANSKNLPSHWDLVIAGTGSMENELRQIAKSYKIDSHVNFAGEITAAELEKLYRKADLFIHPTLYEGSSIVTLEAMMHGLPILATTAGGLSDKVVPEVNGWLVPPGDVKALSNAIQTAYDARNRWAEMGKQSEKIVREQFSWNCTGQLFLETFQQAK
jgi:glycosyltransferase involved in cell wall biosynthesis